MYYMACQWILFWAEIKDNEERASCEDWFSGDVITVVAMRMRIRTDLIMFLFTVYGDAPSFSTDLIVSHSVGKRNATTTGANRCCVVALLHLCGRGFSPASSFEAAAI